MSKEFKDVVEFNQDIIKLAPTDYLNQERLEWFKRTINEELGEFEKANADYIAAKRVNADGDTLLGCQVDMMDAIMDLIYFALGRLYEIGVSDDDFNAMWDAIHHANMTKQRGNKGRGSDDDAIKPEGWQGPEQKFIVYKKSRMFGITTAQNELKKQLDTREVTSCTKNLVNKLNDLQDHKLCQCDKNSFYTINKGRTTTLENYMDNGCTVPSDEIPVKATQMHLPGLKYDDGKPNLSLVFGGFPKALLDVGYVGTFGARKYTPEGWKHVPNLQQRYMSALLRHTFAVLQNDLWDRETGRHHLAHVAWNALALLEDLFEHHTISYNVYNKQCLAQSEETLRKHFENLKDTNNEQTNG